MVTQTYTISTVKNSVPPKVKMSQYDSASRTITFTVVDGSGSAVSLTGKTVTVEGTRIDGHAFASECTVAGATATFTETADMTNQAGDHPAELVVRQNDERLGTMNFIISVESAAMDENASITPEDQSLFDQLYGSIDDAEAEIDTAKDAALQEIAQGLASGSPLIANTAAAMTDTDEVYLYTGSESGYTAGSWYYYNGSNWVVGGVYGAGTVDATLSLAGVAADAKATGDAVGKVKSAIDDVETAIGTETAISDVSINPILGHRYYYSNGEFKDIADVGNTYYSDVLNVSAGQKYYYSGRVYNYQNQYSVIVTDNNSNVLLYELGNTTDTNVVDYPFIIPSGGTTLYITSYRKDSDASSSDLALKQEISTLFQIGRITDEIGGVIPQYYYENDWLQSRIDDVVDNSGFMNGVVFPFITDIHFHSNAGNSKYLLKEILERTSASFVIGGGDYQGGFGGADELQEQFNAFFEFAGYVGHDRFFPIAGNHDFYEATSALADSSTWVKATYGEVYNAIYRPYERWQINRMPGGYCCIDNDAQKTRFILLNSHEASPVASSTYVDGLIRVRPQQIQWLISALKEKTDYKIIVFSHATSDPSMPDYSYTMANVQNVLEAFANKESVTIQFTESWSVTADFTATTNELICHINGHSHVDASHVSNGVLSICTTCDACLQDDGYGATKGTVTEQAFDVFCIDYDAKTINAVRVGRGSNRSWTY